MASEVEKQGSGQDLPPPSDRRLEVRDKWWLILELIWLLILVPKYLLVDLYSKVFPPPGKSLKGQVVLVTGAGRGLGRGLALAFAKEGCKVAVADLDRINATDTAAKIVEYGGVAKAYFTNVAKIDEVKKLNADITKDLGTVDVLVNNAGLIYTDSLLESEEETVQATIAVNLTSHFWMVREFLPAMKKRNSGHIVAISSLSAFHGVANASAYVATKFGVRGFMESVTEELKENPSNNICTTTVFPFFINTSSLYVEHWVTRYPPMSIEEAVEATMIGVKRNEINVTIPNLFYFPLHLIRLLPDSIKEHVQNILYSKISRSSTELRDKYSAGKITKRDV